MKKAIWMKQLYKELNFVKPRPMDIYCDNQGMIKISHNPMYHSKTKHFEVHLNYARDMVEKKKVRISYILTKCPPTNLLTKALGHVKFENCVKLLNPSTDSKL